MQLLAQVGRRLFQCNAQFAGHGPGVNQAIARLRFDGRLAGAKRRDAAAGRKQQGRPPGGDGHGDPARSRRGERARQRRQTERQTQRLEAGGLQHGEEPLQLLLADRELGHISGVRRARERPGDLQLVGRTGENPLRLHLEKARGILR